MKNYKKRKDKIDILNSRHGDDTFSIGCWDRPWRMFMKRMVRAGRMVEITVRDDDHDVIPWCESGCLGDTWKRRKVSQANIERKQTGKDLCKRKCNWQRRRETEMIFSVFGGSLISFVMWNSSFNLPPSLSDQNSENKNFTQILRKIPVGNRHLNEIWREVQFQWTNKTRHVYTPIVTKLQLEILLMIHWKCAWRTMVYTGFGWII